jgi:hypothetical protein
MALLTRVNQVEAGLDLTASFVAAAAGGDTVDNTDGKTLLLFRNGSAGVITVTITPLVSSTTDPVLGTLTKAAVARTVAITTGLSIIGPLSTAGFNQANGQLAITYSGVTTFTVVAVKLP